MRLEKQVALAIAHEVSGRLTTAEESRLARGSTTNSRAYDAYLQGRYLRNERTAETEQGARAYFEQAVREDPSFALAYSGMADYYAVSWHIKLDLPQAEEYARKAIALEPSLAAGHASLGIALVYQGKFAEGEKELKRAIDLNPNYAMAHHWNALRLFVLGRLTEALAESDQARQLDPFSLPINYLRGGMLAGLHQYDRAREQAETAVAINPEAPEPHQQLAWIYWYQGRIPEALTEERKAAVLSGNLAVLHNQEEIAAVYAKSGLRAALLKAAHVKEEAYCGNRPGTAKEGPGCYPALEIADHYAFLKDREKVLYWLDQAVRDRNVGFGLKSAPELDFVRSDPRFQDLLRRAGLRHSLCAISLALLGPIDANTFGRKPGVNLGYQTPRLHCRIAVG